MRRTTIERIGFFHYVEFESPIEALTKALAKAKQTDSGSLGNSLIVLPEAFNLGEYAPQANTVHSVTDFFNSLQELADQNKIRFITGDLQNRSNSAHLVDSTGSYLMCHKVGDDRTGIYDPCTGNADPRNPIEFENAAVGVLICMDAAADDSAQPHVERRLHGFLRRLNSLCGQKIICVPARFTQPRLRLSFLSGPRPCHYVVAQGVFNLAVGCGSYVADESHSRKVVAVQANEIKIWELPK